MLNHSKEDIKLLISNKIAELLKLSNSPHPIDGDEVLSNIGMDSLIMINFIVQIEQEFEITFIDDEMLLENFKTINIVVENILIKIGIRA
jgi:acyl carrier protein